MKIGDARIGQEVRVHDRIGKIAMLYDNGAVYVSRPGEYPERAWASELEPIAPDACESCQKLQGKLNRASAIIKLQKDDIRLVTLGRDAWKAEAESEYRNAAYWREALTKQIVREE